METSELSDAPAKKFKIKRLHRATGTVREYVFLVDPEDAYIVRGSAWTLMKGPQGDYNYVARRTAAGAYEPLHHIILNAPPSEAVYHINGNSLDNRKANLMRSSQRVEEVA